MTTATVEMTLQERIETERIVKSTAQPRTLKQLARNPKSINTSLAIQRNLRWTQEQKTSLIESVLLGYPIPAVYAIKSEDNDTWILDGKQRLTTFISFLNDEWALSELPEVFGEDISNKKYSELPVEFQEILQDHNVVFYQFERLTQDQRDSLFQRLNSGKSLETIEFTRSILGTELLEWMNSITSKPLFEMANISEKQKIKFLEQEILLQMIGVINKEYGRLSGKKLQSLALELRVNGISEEMRKKVSDIVDYIGQAYSRLEEPELKSLLKKNDLVALAAAADVAIEEKLEPEKFVKLTSEVIAKTSGEYRNTKVGSTATEAKVRRRAEIMIDAVRG